MRPSRTDHLKPLLSRIIDECRAIPGGRVARYIPQLATADPERLGLAVCSLDGSIETAGDADASFTIQSVGKPFLYGMALMRFGAERVHRRVGTEPTGQEFNSFTRLDSTSKRPANPMVNAGAIAISDLLLADASDRGDAVSGILGGFGRFAGREALESDASVLESERMHASRNSVIAHLMKHFGLVGSDVDELLQCYFSACAALVTCRDLSVMAACLANGGVNPVSNEELLTPDVASVVLTIMTTCGMYDRSGRFAYEVGMPAKSGVSGAVIAVVPGRYGVAVHSPRLDAGGNSVRGWAALRRLSSAVRGHFMATATGAPHRTEDEATIEKGLEESFRVARAEAGGRVAAYLPRVDHALYAAAVCTVSGHETACGDVDHAFSLQAIANALAFASALERRGERNIRRVVGVEPSGNPFHAILIDERRNRPFNPLGNAGALALAGLDAAARDRSVEDLVAEFAFWAGLAGPLPIDESTLDAEWEYASRNRAIASYLQEVGALTNVEDALTRYLQQCATAVTCRQLARIAATIANSGCRPWDGMRVLRKQVVTKTLAVMYTCGMHDHSGQFALEIGIPSKSGVSGGILAVVPGRMGIAAFAPLVDEAGASVRGHAMLRHLSTELGLGMLHGRRAIAS